MSLLTRLAPALLLLSWLSGSTRVHGAPPDASVRPSLRFTNRVATLSFDLAGGALGDFHLLAAPMNPFSWGAPGPGDARIHGFGHFLCLDRWGPASDAEAANGMPYHGEASNVPWNPDLPVTPTTGGGSQGCMSARLPMAGLRVERSIELSASEAVVRVRETVFNENKLGRVYNCVQHPTIAPPFLGPDTVVDCNGTRGFAQGGKLPMPEEPSFSWPTAWMPDGTSSDLRRLAGNPNPNVVSFIVEGTHGWITALSPSNRLLVGYLWLSRDYPWVSLWRDVHQGSPAARGLEFGTTGLHQPFATLLKKGPIFGRPVVQHLDAGESVTRSYLLFILPVPAGFSGVGNVSLESGRLVIEELAGKNPRRLSLNAGLDLPSAAGP
ncbi:MAG TPA: hypothetical protein DCM86_04890 [Verrucomicrobiales bacterium]|nr:hypothetical protein [Verrucomicrobiales bacterium]